MNIYSAILRLYFHSNGRSFAGGYASGSYMMAGVADGSSSPALTTAPDSGGSRALRSPSLQPAVAATTYRDPELAEVIDFLRNPANVIKANAAAHLAHLAFMNDQVKNAARQLGCIAPLLEMLGSHIPEIQRNACSALRNLSFGRGNDENKVNGRYLWRFIFLSCLNRAECIPFFVPSNIVNQKLNPKLSKIKNQKSKTSR